jgi:hypothetical protein
MNTRQIVRHLGTFRSILGQGCMLLTGVTVAVFLILVATATISYSAARR